MSAGMVKASDTRALAVATIAAARGAVREVAGGWLGPPPQVVAPGDAELQAIAADLAARRDAAIRADDAEAVAAAIEAAILLDRTTRTVHGLAANADCAASSRRTCGSAPRGGDLSVLPGLPARLRTSKSSSAAAMTSAGRGSSSVS